MTGYRAMLLGGDAGTGQTIDIMRKLAEEASGDAQFLRFVIDTVRAVPAYDDMGEVRAIFDWVRRNIRFTKDPLTKEKLTPPMDLLDLRAGDCDDISTLMAAMLLAIGYPAKFVTAAADDAAPNDFSHVYVKAEVPPGSGNWVALDAARPDATLGLEPQVRYRTREWDVADSGYQDVGRLGDWSQVFQQGIAEIPSIIATAQGNAVPIAAGLNPYGSFQTVYTPGATTPNAGYSYNAPSSFSLWLQNNWPMLAIGGLALVALKGRR